ncbi:hypothetical protein HY251_21240 [bacterium]|nr:hypothetical protein [bacterium]
MAVVSVTALVLSAALAERATAIADRDRANRELAGRNEELARSNRELESFATVASHDLQEPLRKVLVFGDRLGARVGGLLDVEGKDHLDRILKASSRMQKLIDDLLAFSRVSTRAEPFVPVALGEVARGVISDLEASIEKTQARVEVGALPTIVADPAQMRQLLQNLVGNALKFHEESKPPVVRIRSEPGPAPRTFRILVEDEGIGFDEKYLDRIFTLFHRLNSRDRYDGTGVGLATCRKIVERHGGSITATSKPGQGSVFAVIIPSERSRGDSA